jgi:4'-phosphopantetheinyl transferase EntD
MINSLEQLFPADAIVVKADEGMWTTPLCPQEEALIEGAVEKRQKEFRAGRHAAHRALEQLHAPWQPLLRGEQRQPIWPVGYLGSITHCRDACVAVCAKTVDLVGLGIDVEPLKPLPKGVDQYIHTPEDEWMMKSDMALPERLIFSAKESIYKCYFPIIGQFIGFQSVSLNLNPHEKTFQFTPTKESTTLFPPEYRFYGRYTLEENHLYTGCFLLTP